MTERGMDGWGLAEGKRTKKPFFLSLAGKLSRDGTTDAKLSACVKSCVPKIYCKKLYYVNLLEEKDLRGSKMRTRGGCFCDTYDFHDNTLEKVGLLLLPRPPPTIQVGRPNHPTILYTTSKTIRAGNNREKRKKKPAESQEKTFFFKSCTYEIKEVLRFLLRFPLKRKNPGFKKNRLMKIWHSSALIK